MKLALPTATFAAGMLAIGMSLSPAQAAGANTVHKWCVHKNDASAVECRYDTLAQCQKFQKTAEGKCSINPKWASLHGSSTTGMKQMEK